MRELIYLFFCFFVFLFRVDINNFIKVAKWHIEEEGGEDFSEVFVSEGSEEDSEESGESTEAEDCDNNNQKEEN